MGERHARLVVTKETERSETIGAPPTRPPPDDIRKDGDGSVGRIAGKGGNGDDAGSGLAGKPGNADGTGSAGGGGTDGRRPHWDMAWSRISVPVGPDPARPTASLAGAAIRRPSSTAALTTTFRARAAPAP